MNAPCSGFRSWCAPTLHRINHLSQWIYKMHLLPQLIRTERRCDQRRRRKPTLECLEARALLSGAPGAEYCGAHGSMAIASVRATNRHETSITMPLTKHHRAISTFANRANGPNVHQANPLAHSPEDATQPRHATGELAHICLHRAVACVRK